MPEPSDAARRVANQHMKHWMGGINPCTCYRCEDLGRALDTFAAQAVTRERDHWQQCYDRANEAVTAEMAIVNRERARAQQAEQERDRLRQEMLMLMDLIIKSDGDPNEILHDIVGQLRKTLSATTPPEADHA